MKSLRYVLAFLVGFVPAALWSQQAESYSYELGSDAVMRSDSVTAPMRIRAGLLLGHSVTLEYTAAYHRPAGEAFQATVSVGFTAAVLPGATNTSGGYVAPAAVLQYIGYRPQFGVELATGTRTETSEHIAARAEMFTTEYFGNRTFKPRNVVGARVGVSIFH